MNNANDLQRPGFGIIDEDWLAANRAEVAPMVQEGWDAAQRGELIDASQVRADLQKKKAEWLGGVAVRRA